MANLKIACMLDDFYNMAAAWHGNLKEVEGEMLDEALELKRQGREAKEDFEAMGDSYELVKAITTKQRKALDAIIHGDFEITVAEDGTLSVSLIRQNL